MGPIVEKMSLPPTVKVQKLHLLNDVHISDQYGVSSAPTFIILKDGKEVSRYRGVMPESRLVDRIMVWLDEH